MIEQAFISGQLGKAIYEDRGRYFVMDMDTREPTECRPMDFSTFFGFGAEVKTLSANRIDLVTLRSELQIQTKAHHALILVISGMDNELDLETRSAVIGQAESLLNEDKTHHFVRSRLLSRPLPQRANITIARDLAIDVSAIVTATLYGNVIDADEAIELVQETWNETAVDYFSSFKDQASATEELLDLGAFADITIAIARGNLDALNSLVVTYAQKAELKGVLRQVSLLLNDFRKRLFDKVNLSPVGRRNKNLERDEPNQEDGSIEAMLSHFKKRRDSRRSRIFSADEAKERVDRQIEAISELIVQGNLNLTNRYLTDLIGFHVRHSQRKHLGMSLCSLAKVAIDSKYFDLAERMVNYALALGVDDVVILNTQAELMKSVGKLDEALAIYKESMACFENDEVARNGYAEVLKAKGALDEALAIYNETMERFPNDVVAPCGYAEISKVMGEFDKALAIYKETMERFPNSEVAHNGYAEVLKAKGEFDEALAVYEETMERFPNNEVARNGYAEVLKVTGEFEKALVVYEETMERFPNDVVAPCGYAEVLKVTGEFDKALAIYKETMERFPNDVVAPCGYAEVLKVTGVLDKALATYKEIMERFPNSEVARNGYAELLKTMGEFDYALVVYGETMKHYKYSRVSRCGYASVLVILNRFEEVRSLLSPSKPRSKDDWIDYHILAMSYLKQGNLDRAIAMFTFGKENAPYTQQTRFVNGLAVARIRKREFDDVIRLLDPHVSNIDVIQRETRLALIGHSHAALGKKEEAAQLISQLNKTRYPHVINLKEAILQRFDLDRRSSRKPLSVSEASALDVRIQDQEYFLAEAA